MSKTKLGLLGVVIGFAWIGAVHAASLPQAPPKQTLVEKVQYYRYYYYNAPAYRGYPPWYGPYPPPYYRHHYWQRRYWHPPHYRPPYYHHHWRRHGY